MFFVEGSVFQKHVQQQQQLEGDSEISIFSEIDVPSFFLVCFRQRLKLDNQEQQNEKFHRLPVTLAQCALHLKKIPMLLKF